MRTVGSLPTEREGRAERRHEIGVVGLVNGLTRKTPQNMAFSGVFVVAAGSLVQESWRARTYAITNALHSWIDAQRMLEPYIEADPGRQD